MKTSKATGETSATVQSLWNAKLVLDRWFAHGTLLLLWRQYRADGMGPGREALNSTREGRIA